MQWGGTRGFAPNYAVTTSMPVPLNFRVSGGAKSANDAEKFTHDNVRHTGFPLTLLDSRQCFDESRYDSEGEFPAALYILGPRKHCYTKERMSLPSLTMRSGLVPYSVKSGRSERVEHLHWLVMVMATCGVNLHDCWTSDHDVRTVECSRPNVVR
jgi:hypothetical protein